MFCNNPISGLCILIACFVPDYKIGLATFLAGSTATLSEMFLQLGPWSAMRAGLTPLNSILIGCVISSLYPTEMDAKMWIFIGIGSFVSVFICAALSNTIGKIKIPYMTLPFNFVALSTFLVLTQSPKNEENVEKIIHTEIDWSQVGRGISVSMAQVYAINNIPASILMNFGVFLTSPLLLIMSFFGAALGSLVGVLLLPLEDIQEVYDGIWGYSAILSSCVICVFFAFNHVSFLLATVNILGTALIQYGLKLTLSLHVSYFGKFLSSFLTSFLCRMVFLSLLFHFVCLRCCLSMLWMKEAICTELKISVFPKNKLLNGLPNGKRQKPNQMSIIRLK